MKKALLIFFIAVVILTMLSPIYFIKQIDPAMDSFEVYMTFLLYCCISGHVVIVEIELFRNIWYFVNKSKKKKYQQVFNISEMVLSITVSIVAVPAIFFNVYFFNNLIIHESIWLSLIIAYILVKLIHLFVWMLKADWETYINSTL